MRCAGRCRCWSGWPPTASGCWAPTIPDTLLFRNNLAMACQAAGETRRVLPLLERVAADGERLLGADHPDTLSFRGNLAAAYHELGDVQRAIGAV